MPKPRGCRSSEGRRRRPLCTHPHAWADDVDTRRRVDANRRWLTEFYHRASPMGFMGGDASREGDRGSARCRDDDVEPTSPAGKYFSPPVVDQSGIGPGYNILSHRSRPHGGPIPDWWGWHGLSRRLLGEDRRSCVLAEILWAASR